MSLQEFSDNEFLLFNNRDTLVYTPILNSNNYDYRRHQAAHIQG